MGETQCTKPALDVQDADELLFEGLKGTKFNTPLPSYENAAKLRTSSRYKTRMIGEYWELKASYEKLKRYCNQIEACEELGELECYKRGIPIPKHDCPLSRLREQQANIGRELHDLEIRAVEEKIDLELL